MKYLIYTDNHFCETSSIVQKFGSRYTARIENQLNSLAWVEQYAINTDCDYIICLGDFFNTQGLTDQEITAVRTIQWNNLPHYFIVGNHESEEIDLKYSSANILAGDNRFVVSEASIEQIGNWEVCFLPYRVSRSIEPIASIFGHKSAFNHRLIFSHNDIKGIQYGPILSTFGFPVEDIEAETDLFINGHIHNGTKVSDKIINLGNLTGQDFKENAFIYSHNIMILETHEDGTFTYELVENPYAFNFYHIKITNEKDLAEFDKIKNQAVLSITCKVGLHSQVNEVLKKYADRIAEKRIITYHDQDSSDEPELDISELSVDYLAELCNCCRAKLDNNPILDYVLAEICK